MLPITRRVFIARLGAGGFAGATLLSWGCGSTSASEARAPMYIGTYTRGGSRGIYRATLDTTTGEIQVEGLVAEMENPSFLTLNPAATRLYAVSEVSEFGGTEGGGVVAFETAPDGALRELNRQPTRGAHPCHVAVDPQGAFVLVANYSGGNVALLPIQADGSLGPPAQVVQHTGSGPNAARQEAPHAHWTGIAPDGRFAFVVDLGIDRVIGYEIDRAAMRLRPGPSIAGVAANPGAGPRHMEFHPDGTRAFVINELDSTLTPVSYEAATGSMESLGTVSTLPESFSGDNSCADVHVHPSGDFVYGSNRGHDSIAVFAVGADGRVTPVQHQSTLGRTPRNFAITPDGRFLVAANQDTSNLVVFSIDPATGMLTPAGDPVEVPTPVCVKFV